MAEKQIRQPNDFYDNVRVDRYVILPKLIPMMLFVLQNGASRTSPPTMRVKIVGVFVL